MRKVSALSSLSSAPLFLENQTPVPGLSKTIGFTLVPNQNLALGTEQLGGLPDVRLVRRHGLFNRRFSLRFMRLIHRNSIHRN